MHQLWPHPNGIWYVLYGPRLKRRISARTRDRGQAETFLAQFIAGTSAPLVNGPTVGEILEGYRADRYNAVRSPGTLRYSCLALGRTLSGLTSNQLLPAVLRRYATTRGAAAGTILREIGTLRAALAWAVEHQWIPAAPIIRNPVKTPPPRNRWLSRDEGRALLAAC